MQRWLGAASLVAVLVANTPAFAVDAAVEDRPAALARLIDAAAGSGFAGEVLIADGDEVVLHRVAGMADRPRGTPHRLNEVWRWASVSKQVMAALAMMSVEQGRLRLDAPVSSVLPSVKDDGADPVRVEDLLRHTSGIARPDDDTSFYTRARRSERNAVLAECLRLPRTARGERFVYNNCDTIILGAVLERVEGQTVDQLIARRIAGPLHLTSLRFIDNASGDSRVKAFGDPDIPSALRVSVFGAAGALKGTATDLLAFDRALMTHRLLSTASTDTLWTGDPKLGYVALGAWSFSAPLKGCTGAVRLVERRGDVGGIQVRNILAPDRQVAVIVFTNDAAFDFGEVWQGTGFSHDLLSATLCPNGVR